MSKENEGRNREEKKLRGGKAKEKKRREETRREENEDKRRDGKRRPRDRFTCQARHSSEDIIWQLRYFVSR